MALINCPECARQVSDMATACPGCAYPLKPATTIEATAKPWKALGALGAIGFVCGFLLLGNDHIDAGMWTIVGSIFVITIARAGAYWENG